MRHLVVVRRADSPPNIQTASKLLLSCTLRILMWQIPLLSTSTRTNYYGVPLFKLEDSSQTSCPAEPASGAIEQPKITPSGPTVLSDIPEDSKYGAVFTVEISNQSFNYSIFVLYPDPTTTGAPWW